jgi:hypothetical protein
MNKIIQGKTQEIVFALIRIATQIRRFELKKRIENLGYNLLENIYDNNLDLATLTTNTLQGFIELGKNIYEIEPVNAKLILSELDILTEQIHKINGTAKNLTLNGFFTKIENKEINEEIDKKEENKEIKPKISQKTDNVDTDKETKEEIDNRQKEIIDKIRQSANNQMQLKEISAEFPNLSDRTIRYDLKKLTKSNILQRSGAGPASTYSLKNAQDNPNSNNSGNQQEISVITL